MSSSRIAGDLSRTPTRIASLRDKLKSLEKTGVDRVIVEHFNAHVAAIPPRDCVEKVLV